MLWYPKKFYWPKPSLPWIRQQKTIVLPKTFQIYVLIQHQDHSDGHSLLFNGFYKIEFNPKLIVFLIFGTIFLFYFYFLVKTFLLIKNYGMWVCDPFIIKEFVSFFCSIDFLTLEACFPFLSFFFSFNFLLIFLLFFSLLFFLCTYYFFLLWV